MSQFRRRLFMMMQDRQLPIHFVKCLVKINNKAYFDTEYIVTQNTNMHLKYIFDTESFVFGARIDSSKNNYGIFYNRPDYGSTGTIALVQNSDGIIDVEFKNGYIYNNDEIVGTGNTQNVVSGLSLFLFGINNNGSPRLGSGRIKVYSLQLYEDDVLTREFLPALDSNGVACFYETVQGKYYYGIDGDFGYVE